MSLKVDIVVILTAAEICMSFFLIIILLTDRKGILLTKTIFSLILFAINASLFNYGILIYSGFHNFNNDIMIPVLSLSFIGPLLYIHTRLITSDEHMAQARMIIHFIVPAFLTLAWISLCNKGGGNEIISVYNWTSNGTDLPSGIKSHVIPVVTVIELYIYLYAIHHRIRSIPDGASPEKYDHDLFLLKTFINTTTAVSLVLSALLVSSVLAGYDLLLTHMIGPLIILGLLFYLAFRAIRHLSHDGVSIPSKQSQNIVIPAKLSPSEIEDIIDRIHSAMITEHLFRDMSITLPDFARKIGVTRNQMSYVLNNHFNECFFDFINRYRIDEVKRILDNTGDKDINLLRISLDVGFKSKTTFNVNFKKMTNMSPSEYRRRARAS